MWRDSYTVAFACAAGGLFVGLIFHVIARRATKAEIRRLTLALKAAPSTAKAAIASDYTAQIRVFTDGITQLRADLQNIDIDIARQKRVATDATTSSGSSAPEENDLAVQLDRTLAKRAYLKTSIDALVQRKVGWVEGERLIQSADYAKDAWRDARRDLDTELARIAAGQIELRHAAASAIKDIKQDHQRAAQKSEVLDNQRHELSTRTNLSK